jgi:hypothetical protein
MLAAQRVFPRLEVGEIVAKRLVTIGGCAEAEPEIERLLAWTPHHMGPYKLAIACAEAAGRTEEAQALRRSMRRLAPTEMDTGPRLASAEGYAQ